jgi:hypothetical protein
MFFLLRVQHIIFLLNRVRCMDCQNFLLLLNFFAYFPFMIEALIKNLFLRMKL